MTDVLEVMVKKNHGGFIGLTSVDHHNMCF